MHSIALTQENRFTFYLQDASSTLYAGIGASGTACREFMNEIIQNNRDTSKFVLNHFRDKYFGATLTGLDANLKQQYLPSDLTIPHERSLTSFNEISKQYLPPSSRSISQEYGPPNVREGRTKKYGLPSPDTSIFRSGLSQEYSAPLARFSHKLPNSDSNQRFSSVSLITLASQRYVAPSSRNSPSSVYGSSSLRSLPTSEYGAPQLRSSNEHTQRAFPIQTSDSSFRRTKSHARSVFQQYDTPMDSDSKSQDSGNPFQRFGVPARSLSTQYEKTSAKSSGYSFEERDGPVDITYGVPNGRNIDQGGRTYGTSNLERSDKKSDASAKSYHSRRTPSLKYGTPSFRATGPSQEYGTPQGSLDNQDFEYAINALELHNQASANYEFSYKVSDDDTGSDFGHSESRQLDRAEGAYFVLLPDGTKQVVEYEADEDGFKPRISVEPVDSATALAAEGPY